MRTSLQAQEFVPRLYTFQPQPIEWALAGNAITGLGQILPHQWDSVYGRMFVTRSTGKRDSSGRATIFRPLPEVSLTGAGYAFVEA